MKKIIFDYKNGASYRNKKKWFPKVTYINYRALN